jgi:hypothetical protein
MPAACSFSGRLSTRNASITMSWVADAVATRMAATIASTGPLLGSQTLRIAIAAISISCENTSQPRRRPNLCESSGMSSASTSGAQRNLMV